MELSTNTFYRARDLKRQGLYDDAIKIYQQEISKMLYAGDFRELTTYTHALAKCFYLKRNYNKAICCYLASMDYNMLINPEMIDDFMEDDAHFNDYAAGLSTYIGYCAHGWEQDYADAIAGKGGSYNPDKYLSKGIKYVLNEISIVIKSGSINTAKTLLLNNLTEIGVCK